MNAISGWWRGIANAISRWRRGIANAISRWRRGIANAISRWWRGMTPRDVTAIIFMPLLTLALTAALGIFVGQKLQDMSFRRNELFKANLGAIMFGQAQAVDIVREVELVLRQVRSNEEFIAAELGRAEEDMRTAALAHYRSEAPFNSSIVTLSALKVKLEVLGRYDESVNNNAVVSRAAEIATDAIDDYIGCVKRNDNFERRCGDEHPEVMSALNDVMFAYGSGIKEFIEEYR